MGVYDFMEEINLLEVLQYFKNKVLWIIGAVVVALLVGNLYTYVTRVPMYKSETTLILASSNGGVSFSQNDISLNKNLVSTYSEIVKSRKVLKQVIKNLDLDTTVEAISKTVSVTAVPDTEIIKIGVSHEDPEIAKDITNEIGVVFSEEIKGLYNLDNVSVLDKAIEAEAPYNVNYPKDNLMYLLAGLVLSCGVIFVIYYFDTTIKSAEIVEDKFGLIVLGVVPEEGRGK